MSFCLASALLAAVGCSQAAPARTGSSVAAAPAAQKPAAPAESSAAPAAAAPKPVEGVGTVGQPSATGAAVLEPPDGKWLTDENGQQYFIMEVPRIEGEYIWEDKDTVRLRGGMPLKLARYDDKTFYAKVFKVLPGEGSPVRGHKPTVSELEKAAETYKLNIPEVSRLRLEPFDSGLPQAGQWRNGFDVADMNGDGQLDIVHGPPRKAGGSPPQIFLGDGKGSWRPWTEARFPGDVLFDYGSAAVADFNRDGHMDVAVAMHILGLRVLVGDGKGGFKLWSEGLDYHIPQEGDPPPGFSSRAITAVDWNRDQRPDLLALGEGMHLNVANEKKAEFSKGSSFGTVVYLNEGNGKWDRKDEGTNESQVFGDTLATGDFDGDGRLDAVTSASFLDRGDIVHLGRGDTWETVSLPLRPRGFVTAVTAGDFDHDGRDDVAVAYVNSELGVSRYGIDVFLARPGKDGLSWERRGLAVGGGRLGYFALAAGDLDGDKLTDLVGLTGDGQVTIFLGESQGFLARAEIPAGGAAAAEPGCRGYDVHLVDLDKDGRDEIVADFAGEQDTGQIIRSLGAEGYKAACPTEGAIRVWKAVAAGAAQ